MSDLLNFDPERYLTIQKAAVANASEIADCVDAIAARGLDSVLFLGAGGAGILMEPAAQLLEAQSSLRSRRMIGGELVANGWAPLGEQTLVVMPSLSGTTPDALRQIDVVKAAGATVLALVGNADTPVAIESDYVIVNEAADDTSSESFYLQSHIVAATIMHRRGEWNDAIEHIKALESLPEALLSAKLSVERDAAIWAKQLAATDWHIITSAGPSWTEAHYYGMCILEEMQWIRTRPVHAYDFFHGTLELVESDTSILILKGEGPTRQMVERVEKFASNLTNKLLVIDSANYDMGEVTTSARALLAPAMHAALLERVSAHLEVLRDHPLDTRRYYRRLDY